MRTSRLTSLVAASAASALTIGGLVFAAPSLAAPSGPKTSPSAACSAALDAFETEFGNTADVDEELVTQLLSQYEDLLTEAESHLAAYDAAEQASQQAHAALPALQDDVTTADAAVVDAQAALDVAQSGPGQIVIAQVGRTATAIPDPAQILAQIAAAQAALDAARQAAADAAGALAAGEDAAAEADAALADASARLDALDQQLAGIEAQLEDALGGGDVDLDRFVQVVTDLAKACQSAGTADKVDAAPAVDRTPTVRTAPAAKPVPARASFTG